MNQLFTQIWRHPSRILVILVCQIGLGWTGFAQQPVDPATAQRPRKVFPAELETPDDVLRIDTDVVSVDVSVTDAEGRPVRNLTKKDFKLFADGQEQALSFFQVERRAGPPRPLAIVFAVDISGSMTTDEMLRLRTALRAFSSNVGDQQAVYAVMAFGMNVKTLQRFTTEASKLDRALERVAREPNGLSTHTYDAVDDAIRLLVRQAPRTRDRRLLKRAVIVVTDGFPVGDTVSAETVIERANQADVSVYTVTLPSYSRAIASTAQTPLPTPLDVSELAERTGGRNLYADQKDYQHLFRALAEEVTSTYVLAFYPAEEKRRDGKFHEIKVQGPNGLTVRQSRPGYQAQGGNSRPQR